MQVQALGPTKKTAKPPLRAHETALEGVENSPHPPRDGKRTLTSKAEELGESLVRVPIELIIQSSGHKVGLMGLLDLGCTKCLVNPALLEKLGVRLRPLNVLVAFCQLDGSVAREILS